SASRCDALAYSIAKVDPKIYALNDSISKQQDIDEGTKSYLIDHIFVGKGTSHIEQQIKEEFNTSPDLSSSDDAKKEIKSASRCDALAYSIAKVDPKIYALNDSISKQQDIDEGTKSYLIDHIFVDLDSPKNEPIIVVDESEDEKTKDIHGTSHIEIEDTSVPTPPSPRSIQLQELTNQVLILHSQKRKQELKKNKAKDKAKVALLSTQSSFLMWHSSLSFCPPKSSSQPQEEPIKKDKGKKAISFKDAKEKSTQKQIKEQKKIEECTKADAAKRKVGIRKEELVDVLDKSLGGKDPLNKLNEHAKKKRKHADGIHDCFKVNKRLKSSVQYEDHPARTVLNKPVLSMIMFNSFYKQDCVTNEDFEDFINEMLYAIQEIFFRLHQGPGLDDHARTFSSLLLAEVNKRNLKPLKQIRTIKQLR
nr:hypothetical protein [Tanacetum cinerariifolium]